MGKNALTHPYQPSGKISLHDQIQIALAIAEENILKTLLTNCAPPLAQPHRLGNVSSSIAVPIKAKKAIDGIIEFETIHCALADTPVETDPHSAQAAFDNYPKYRNHSLTRCESELHHLGHQMVMNQAIALLAHSGFSPRQVEAILNLPHEAWHKTWWYAVDAEGNFSTPFLRMIRTLRYTDGTFTIQYKDYFSQDKPTCFRSTEEKVVVEIRSEEHDFSQTLGKINYSREKTGISKALLICNSISDLEARGFISQGISIYATNELALPVQANCVYCANYDCPMNGCEDSPVMMCRRFCLDGTEA